MLPARVVGRIAEILDAVPRQLPLRPAGHVANPQVPVAQEDRTLAVRREHRRRRRTPLYEIAGDLPGVQRGKLGTDIGASQPAIIPLAPDRHDRAGLGVVRFQVFEAELGRIPLLQAGGIERRQQPKGLECRRLRASDRIAQHDRRHAVIAIHVPEAPRVDPMRRAHRMIDEGRRPRCQLMVCAGVIRGGHLRLVLRGGRPGDHDGT